MKRKFATVVVTSIQPYLGSLAPQCTAYSQEVLYRSVISGVEYAQRENRTSEFTRSKNSLRNPVCGFLKTAVLSEGVAEGE